MKIIKNNGEWTTFEPANLINSLKKSGAQDDEVQHIYNCIQSMLYEGISTKAIYDTAYKMLKELRSSYASKYSLKQALSDLGPTGFFFEKWVCHILNYLGYKAQNGITLVGHAVTHEIDVIATKNDALLIAECKLRNASEAKISVTTPMYYLSRMNDLKNKPHHTFGSGMHITEGWLITNAYFTSDAIDFAEYYGVKLLAWNYPLDSSISTLTDDSQLYPITCLTEIDKKTKTALLEKNIILVEDILKHKDKVKSLINNNNHYNKIIKEVREFLEN